MSRHSFGSTHVDRRSRPARLCAVILAAALTALQANAGDFDDGPPAPMHHPAWFKEGFLDLAGDLAEARDAGKDGIIVYIGTRNCSYCRAFNEQTLGMRDIEARVRRHFDVIGLEIFSDEELTDLDGSVVTVKDFVAREKARFTPTLIFYASDGQEVFRFVGYYPPEKFRQALDYVLGGHYRSMTFRSFSADADAEQRRAEPALSPADELFSGPPYALDRTARPAERPLLVIFEQPHCDACRELHQNTLRDPELRRLLRAFEVVRLDATDAATPVLMPTGGRITPQQWVERLGLDFAPSFVFFDEDGAEVLRIDATVFAGRLKGSLRYVLDKAYLEENQLQRWRRSRALGRG